MSKKTARKYFGKEDPLGKIVKVDNKDDYKITGIFDEIPHNSHFRFEVMASLESIEESREQIWWRNNFYTYLLLGKQVDPRSLAAKFPGIIKKYMAPQLEKLAGQSYDKMIASGNLVLDFSLQPMRQIHLYSDLLTELGTNSDIKYVYIFSAIAFFILVIASINFTNLSTARSAGRAKEVGIRKVVGAPRSQLVRQFLTESIILSILSMIIALVMVNLLLPFFNRLAGKELTLSDFYGGEMILAVLVITLLTGLLAGLYPAFFISALQPITVLKGRLKSGVKSGWLRSGLVVFQFTTSIVLMICTLAVMNQLRYIQEKKLGFDKEQVIILYNTHLLGKQAETFKNELLTYASIKSAAISSYLPIPSNRNESVVFPEGQINDKNSTTMQIWRVDYDYIKTLGMKIVKGRNFSREFSTDNTAVIINRQVVRQFDWKEPLGKHLSRITSTQGDITNYTVVGVVEDFHFDSLRDTIAPLIMLLGNSDELTSFRIDTKDIPGTIALLQEKWNQFLPGQPFEYFFMDERFNDIYKAEWQLGKIFGVFAFLSILVGCLGLFGLASFIAERRTKEISIRKVLGASVTGIIRLLSKEFVILVGIANAIAWPLAYIIMNKWLQGFAYRTSLHIITFLAAGAAAVIITLLTTGYQAIKAALSDPVQSLKYE
jgi:putative ABC transport system permease protein